MTKLCKDCAHGLSGKPELDFGYCPLMRCSFTFDVPGCYWWEKKNDETKKTEN